MFSVEVRISPNHSNYFLPNDIIAEKTEKDNEDFDYQFLSNNLYI